MIPNRQRESRAEAKPGRAVGFEVGAGWSARATCSSMQLTWYECMPIPIAPPTRPVSNGVHASIARTKNDANTERAEGLEL
jgi:hypothetical protein